MPGRCGEDGSCYDDLPVGWFRGRRLRCGLLRRFRSGCRRGSRAAFDRIGLIIEAHDVLGDVDVGGGKKNRRVLRGSVENGHVAVFASVAVEDVDHFAAGAIEDVGLRGVYVFLIFILLALRLASLYFTLALEAESFLRTQLSLAGVKTLPQVVDLLVQGLELILARSELRLQLGASLLAFRGAGDSLAHINHADFARPPAPRSGGLRRHRGGAQKEPGGERSEVKYRFARPRTGRGPRA